MASSTAQNLLTRLYPNGVAWSGYKRSKFLSRVKKDTNFGGEGRYTIVSIAPTTGGSADFQKALKNQGPTNQVRFFVEHKTEYQIFSVSGKAIAQNKKDKQKIVELWKHEFDRTGYAFGRSLASGVWGNGGGSLATTATTSGTSITLTQRTDARKFEVGMYLTFAPDDGTALSPAGEFDSGKSLQVTSVNGGTGVIGLSADISTVSGVTGTFYVFREGDYANKMTGIPGIIPAATISGSDSFRGVNRSTHRDRLAGVYLDSSLAGGTKSETLINAIAEGEIRGATVGSSCYVNSLDFSDIVKEKVATMWVDSQTTNPNISVKGLVLPTQNGEVSLYSEPDCPRGKYWILNDEDWVLRSAGECPHVLDEDNLMKLRAENADAYQGRLGGYLELDCTNPGNQVVGVFG